jgi:hypothetical protein
MSAWRIGADLRQRAEARPAVADLPAGSAQSTADLVQKAADVYTKWIPGDVLAAYLALTAAFRGTIEDGAPESTTPHAWGILVAGLGMAAGVSLLGAIAANLREGRDDRMPIGPILGRAVLAVIAFGLWSLTMPGSWWEVQGWNAGVLAAISLAVSIVFALVAEIVVALLQPGPA